MKRSVLFHLPKPSNLFCSSGSKCASCPHHLKAWQCCEGHYTALTRKAMFKNQFRSPHFLIRVSWQKHNVPLVYTLVFAGGCTGTHVTKKMLHVFPERLSAEVSPTASPPLGSRGSTWGEPALLFLLPLSVRSWLWLLWTTLGILPSGQLLYLFTYVYIYLTESGLAIIAPWGEKGLRTCEVGECCWAKQNWQVLGTQTPFGTFSSNKINFQTPWTL